MEYMMVRSMKSGGNPDPPTSTLTMIPDHHHNHHNHLQQQQMQVHHQQQQQQQQRQQQQQSLVDQQVSDLYTALNCGDLSNSTVTNDTSDANWNSSLVGGGVQLQQPGGSNIPILFKSSEIYERIVASSSIPSQSNATVQLSNFSGTPTLNHIKSESLYGQVVKNHLVQQRTPQQFVVSNNYQSDPFQGGLVVSNSSVSREKSVKKSKMKTHKRKRKLWEYSLKKSCESSSPLESSKPTSSAATSNSNALVSLSRKRKASSNPTSSLQFMNKRAKTSFTPVNSAVAFGSMSNKSSLCSQMPNLFKALHPKDEVGSDKYIKSDLMQPKIEKVESRLSLVPTRPSLPIENIFLKKYDPIRLLTRLCASNVKSETGTPVVGKVLMEEKFPRGSHRSAQLKSEILNTNLGWTVGQNLKTKPPQSLGFSSSFSNVFKQEPLMKPPTSLPKKSKKDNGVVAKRKSHKKLKRKRQRKYPKFVKPKRKLNVRFNSGGKGVPQLRVRVLAAIYLNRAISRLRRGRRFRGRKFAKLSKIRRSHKRIHPLKPPETAGPVEVLKKGKEKNCLKKFQFTQLPLPKAIPVSTVKVNLPYNEYLSHTIELLHHKRELQDRLESMESDGVVYKLVGLPEKVEHVKTPFISQNVMMKRRQVKEVLSERLLTNIAHAGFTHTKLRPLEVMADIVADFLMNTARRLKDVTEVEMTGADHGFPDAMERVLNEMGMGGIRGLEEFYRTRVLDYGQRMEDQCAVLRRQYAYKVRSKVGLGNSTSTSSTTSPTASVVTVSSGSRPVINTSKTASTSSSQPLSPGNSMLAEMLSNQEESSGRTIHASSSPSMGEKQLEDLMVAPPNVEIRPNSYHSRQQLPLHQLLASLSQQQPPQVVAQPQLVRAAPPSTVTVPAAVINQSYQLQHQSHQHHQQQAASPQQQNVLQASTPPHYQLGSQNSNHHPTHQSSSQGLHHNQPHLTQLLQRPITNQASPTSHHHHHPATPTQPPPHHHHLVIQSPGQVHQSQYQGVPLAPAAAAPQVVAQLQNSSSPGNQLRSVSLNNNNRPLITMPIQINLGKQGHQSPSLKTEIPCTVPAAQSPSLKPATGTNKGKTVTIIRSSSNASSPGIILSNDRPTSNNSADVLPDFSSAHGGSNVISINLGSNSIDLDHSKVPQTVTMHAADAGISATGVSTGSSKAKLKEAINQRNLLRLNFEQVPSAGESTVLLSSGSAPVANNATGNVQFVGKVTPGQTITWNSNYQ